MEREIRNELTDAANEAAIRNFALNLQAAAHAAAGQGLRHDGARPRLQRTAARSPSSTRPARCWTPRSSTRRSPNAKSSEAIAKLAALIRKHGVGASRHRQRHGQPRDGGDGRRADPRSGRRCLLYDRQRGGGVGLFRVQARRRGIPAVRRQPPLARSPLRAGCRIRWRSW